MTATFTVDEPTLRRNSVLATSYADQCRTWAREFTNPEFYEQYAQSVGAIGAPLVEALKTQGAQIVTMATQLASEFDTLAQASTVAVEGVVDSDTAGAGFVNNAASELGNGNGSHAHTTAAVAPAGKGDIASYIVKEGEQLNLTPTEVDMALAVAKHESNWDPVGFMGFGPEAKAAGYNFDNNSYGAVDQYYKQYVDRLPTGLDRNDPTAVANYIWHTVHNAADPNYGPELLAAYGELV